MEIKESWIAEQAVNANALKNAKALVQSGKFVRLVRSEDDTFYMGECQGSGSSNYTTSADFLDPAHPVFRCSCPSRQFPCKHSLGLLYAIAQKAAFETGAIPEDILRKRERLAKRSTQPETEAEPPQAKPKKTKKTANKKRWLKQLEGLDVCDRMLRDLVRSGVSAFVNNSLKDYEALAKQMNDYYLPGIQRQLVTLIAAARTAQTSEGTYDVVFTELLRLNQTVKQGRQYLNKKLQDQPVTLEEKGIEEGLGTIWNLSDLKEQGFEIGEQSLIQLGFRVRYDSAHQETVEEGFWFVHPLNEIHKTIHIRPKKAEKYIREEDSVLMKIKAPAVYLYPGAGNRRLRYEETRTTEPLNGDDYARIRQAAGETLETVIKDVKNKLKNPFVKNEVAALVAYAEIRRQDEGFVMVDRQGEALALSPLEGMSLMALTALPEQKLLADQCALLLFSYEAQTHRLIAKPMSLISAEHIVRLLY